MRLLLLFVAVLSLLFLGGRHLHLSDAGSHPQNQGKVADAFHIFRSPPEHLPQIREDRLISTIAPIERGAKLFNVQVQATMHGQVWAFETEDLVCLAQTSSAACAPKAKAVQTGVVLGVFSPPNKTQRELHGFRVQGIVPDSVKRVLVVVNSQNEFMVDVRENFFSVAADKPIHVKRLLRH